MYASIHANDRAPHVWGGNHSEEVGGGCWANVCYETLGAVVIHVDSPADLAHLGQALLDLARKLRKARKPVSDGECGPGND